MYILYSFNLYYIFNYLNKAYCQNKKLIKVEMRKRGENKRKVQEQWAQWRWGGNVADMKTHTYVSVSA